MLRVSAPRTKGTFDTAIGGPRRQRRRRWSTSAADNQVVVQTPDPGHRPTGELDLPPKALRRYGPGQSDQAIRPGRNHDPVVAQPGVAGQCVADRGFDVERLTTRVAPCAGIPHHVLVRPCRHHSDAPGENTTPATHDRSCLMIIDRVYAAVGRAEDKWLELVSHGSTVGDMPAGAVSRAARVSEVPGRRGGTGGRRRRRRTRRWSRARR